MQLDPIAQQTLLSALRNTQSQKLSPTEKLPDTQPLPQDQLSSSENSEDLSYKPCPELVANNSAEPATASGSQSHQSGLRRSLGGWAWGGRERRGAAMDSGGGRLEGGRTVRTGA